MVITVFISILYLFSEKNRLQLAPRLVGFSDEKNNIYIYKLSP